VSMGSRIALDPACPSLIMTRVVSARYISRRGLNSRSYARRRSAGTASIGYSPDGRVGLPHLL
jgi:hypothetical protein